MRDRNYGQMYFLLFPQCTDNTGHTGGFGTERKKQKIDLPIIAIPQATARFFTIFLDSLQKWFSESPQVFCQIIR